MDQKEELKLLTDLYMRILKNRIIYFLKDYKRSVPLILYFSCLTFFLGYMMFFTSFPRTEYVTQDLSSTDPKIIRIIGCGIGLFIILMSLAPWGYIKVFDAPTREFIFPSPIRRRTIMIYKIRNIYRQIIFVMLLIFIFFIYFFTSSFSIRISLIQWLKIIFSAVVISIIFMNIGLIWTFKMEKNLNKWYKTITNIFFVLILIALSYFIYIFYNDVATGISPGVSINNLLYSPPYYVALFIPHFAIDIILAQTFDIFILAKYFILISLAIITSFHCTKLDFFVYEEESLEMISRFKRIAVGIAPLAPYSTPGYGGFQFEREIKPEIPWWRKGPLRNLKWDFPNTGNREWAIFDKNIILTVRLPIYIFIQLTTTLLLLFILIIIGGLTRGLTVIFLPFLVIMVTLAIMMIILNYNLLKERKQLEIIKMLPIKGSKIINISLISTIFIPIIFYSTFISILLIITNYIDILTIYLSYICGPVFIILCAVGIHFSYLLVIKKIEFSKIGGSIPFFITGAILIISISIFNILLFSILSFTLPYEGAYFVLLLLILTLVNLILIIIFHKISVNLYEKSDIRG